MPNGNFFRSAPQCSAFTVEGSTQGSWPASPVGKTATIECAAAHILVGSATLTCQQDGTWSNDIPQCDKAGIRLISFIHSSWFIVIQIKQKCKTLVSSNEHFPPVCTGFTVDGSVQGSWSDTDAGQTVTINCQEKHVLDGSSERTCNSNGEWNKEAPLCILELGK